MTGMEELGLTEGVADLLLCLTFIPESRLSWPKGRWNH